MNYLQALIQKLKGAKRSLTIWFNGVVSSVALLLPELVAFLPQIKEYLPTNFYGHLLVIALVGNFLIRFRTSSALEDKRDATKTTS